MKHPRLLLLVASMMVGSLFTPPVMAAPPAGTKLAPVQELNLNFNTDLSTFDPQLVAYFNDFEVQHMLNDTLFRLSEHNELVPSLAQSYEVSADGLTWTFYLRDAQWSDGKPITAQDFVYSWRRLTNPKTGADYQNYLQLANVVHATEVAAGKLPLQALGVQALNEHTLQVNLLTPIPWFKSMLAISMLAPLREDIITKYGEHWVDPEHMVVSGPYQIKTYSFKDRLELVRNSHYWDNAHTTLNALHIDFISDPNAGYYGFSSGKYLFTTIPAQFLTTVREKFPQEVLATHIDRVEWLRVNVHKVPDIRARQALGLLIDRQVLTQKIWHKGIPTSMLAPASIAGAQAMQESDYIHQDYATNRAQAITLLQQAGYTHEHPLKLQLLSSSKDTKFFVALQNWYNRGTGGLIQLSLDAVENKVYYDRVARYDYDLSFAGWGADYPHVSTFLDLFTCGNTISYSRFCDLQYDQLLQQAKYTQDDTTRAKIYAQAELILRQSYHSLPVDQDQRLILKSTKLGGFNPDDPMHYFNDFYIKAAE